MEARRARNFTFSSRVPTVTRKQSVQWVSMPLIYQQHFITIYPVETKKEEVPISTDDAVVRHGLVDLLGLWNDEENEIGIRGVDLLH